MGSNVYALAVGINNYKSPNIPYLKGCVNDVIAVEEFLRKRLINSEDKLFIKTLINQEATRQAIVNAFREHLCQAKSDDIALFYYSGHGSQEEASKEFWHIEPDHLNETLVCWDSREDGIWDLADKEIAKLIAEVADNHPQIIVILDSCHSGGAARGENNNTYTGVRSVNTNLKERPLSSFIFPKEEINSLFPTPDSNDNKLNRFSLSKGKYIFLAACRDNEEATEHFSQKRGAFSYFLFDSLQRDSNLTYRDLFKRTNALVRSFYPKQSPQIEAANSSYLDQAFLGGLITKTQIYFTVIYDSLNGWTIDGGAVHGIIFSNNHEKTRLAIFSIDVEDISQLQNAIAVAEITEVLPQLSKITISGQKRELDLKLIYKAVITSLPASLLKIYIDGEESGIKFARQAIRKASFGNNPSLYICEVNDISEADVFLEAVSDKYHIIRISDERKLVSPIIGFSEESASQTIQALEHIAKWINICTLSSPANSLIPNDAVLMQVYHRNSEIIDYQIDLQYQLNDGKLQPPAIQIKLTNTSDKVLYCALLNLTENFAITAIPFAGNSTEIRLEPKQEIWVLEGKYISLFIPENFYKSGIRKCKDIFKLIVSTSEFDANLLVQDKIAIVNKRSRSSSTSIQTNNHYDFHQSILKAKSRAIVAYQTEPEIPDIFDDWVTKEILIVTTSSSKLNEPQSDEHKPINRPNPGSNTQTKNVSKNNLRHILSKKHKIILIVLLVFIMTVIILFAWKKSQRKETSKQITSFYLSSIFLTKF